MKERSSESNKIAILDPKGKDSSSTSSQAETGDFAPSNPTDGRDAYDWVSRWPIEAKKIQRREGIYLAILWALGLTGIFGLTLSTENLDIVTSMALVFFAGLLGGTTFDVKWWYHTIARGIWHSDRHAWRLAVPWVAAIVAMFVHILFKSDLLGILNPAAMDKFHNTLAFGFLVGYFSDSAIAKLAEIAESLFGDRGNQGVQLKEHRQSQQSQQSPLQRSTPS